MVYPALESNSLQVASYLSCSKDDDIKQYVTRIL